jgi:hypothetical protein
VYEIPIAPVATSFCTVCVFYVDFWVNLFRSVVIRSDIMRFAALVISTCQKNMNDL